MRDRLIELLSSITCWGNDCDERGCGKCGKIGLPTDDIVILADHLLANGVVVPPCKVGDSCYPLDASETELTCEEKISRITISERNIIIGYYEHWDYYKKCRKEDTWRLPLRTRILGKSVFLTKEQAEAKLQEGKG